MHGANSVPVPELQATPFSGCQEASRHNCHSPFVCTNIFLVQLLLQLATCKRGVHKGWYIQYIRESDGCCGKLRELLVHRLQPQLDYWLINPAVTIRAYVHTHTQDSKKDVCVPACLPSTFATVSGV